MPDSRRQFEPGQGSGRSPAQILAVRRRFGKARVVVSHEGRKEGIAIRQSDRTMSTGNQGVALMLLAERLGGVTKARSAVQQIEVAFATMRAWGGPSRRVLRSATAQGPIAS
jgi:hypothetical protein